MTIGFNDIPSNVAIPFIAVEFDGSNAGAALSEDRALIIAQMTSTGTGVVNTLYPITSEADAAKLGGARSNAFALAEAWFGVNKSTDTYLLLVADNGSGVAPVWTVTLTGTATESRELPLYIGDKRVSVSVTSGDTAAVVASAANAALALAANQNLPLTASVAGGVVTLTFAHKGEVGNQLSVGYALQRGEALASGLTCAVAQTVNGSGNPVLTSALAVTQGEDFMVAVVPWNDATSLAALAADGASKWGPMTKLDIGYMFPVSGSLSTQRAVGDALNSKHLWGVGGIGAISPRPMYQVAASAAANVAFYGAISAARPFQTLGIPGLGPRRGSRFSDYPELNLLVGSSGIGAAHATNESDLSILSLVTTYKTNASGAPDQAYRSVNTMLTLRAARRSFISRIARKYPRHMLAADSERNPPGLPIMTQSVGTTEALAWYNDEVAAGRFEAAGFDTFKSALRVEINGTNKNRLDWNLPPDLMGQFVVGAAKIQFVL